MESATLKPHQNNLGVNSKKNSLEKYSESKNFTNEIDIEFKNLRIENQCRCDCIKAVHTV